MTQQKPDRLKAADIVRDAGGQIVGRTRLQKVAFLLELAGLGEGFQFEYKHYGPFSEELATGIHEASVFGLVDEEERPTSWGGLYSIYSAATHSNTGANVLRSALAEEAAKIDSVELELAATAAYLSAVEGYDDPWAETERRKPEKATGGRLARAKKEYRRLMRMETLRPLPKIA